MAFEPYRTTGEGQEYYRRRLLRTIEHVAPEVLRDLERDVLPAYEALTRYLEDGRARAAVDPYGDTMFRGEPAPAGPPPPTPDPGDYERALGAWIRTPPPPHESRWPSHEIEVAPLPGGGVAVGSETAFPDIDWDRVRALDWERM